MVFEEDSAWQPFCVSDPLLFIRINPFPVGVLPPCLIIHSDVLHGINSQW